MVGIYEGKDLPTIVVIDDEEIVLAGYQMLFESWNYRVIAASSGQEAVEMVRNSGCIPAFILADYRLKEGLTGIEAIEAVRNTFGVTIPSVLVTGDTAIDRLRSASASGLLVLHKPVNGRQLQDLLRQTFSSAA